MPRAKEILPHAILGTQAIGSSLENRFRNRALYFLRYILVDSWAYQPCVEQKKLRNVHIT
jgi:hypothetical protein